MYKIYLKNVSGVSLPPEVLNQFEEAECRAVHIAKLASEIGLPGIALQDVQKVETQKVLEWCKVHELMPLSAEEYGIWSDFLPSGYVNNWNIFAEKRSRGHWDTYTHFEGVPLHVRELIRDVKDVFTTLEIRTPEKRPQGLPDPALFGHVVSGNSIRTFLLARWSESDANFLTFEDVKQVIEIRKARACLDGDHVLLGMVLSIIASGFWFVAIHAGVSAEWGLAIACVSIAGCVTCVATHLFRKYLKYRRAGSTKQFPWLERFI